MTDIATLTFTVDSSQAQNASQSLDALRGNAAKADEAMQSFQRAASLGTGALPGFTSGLAASTSQLNSFANSLQSVLTHLQETRSALESTSQSFANFARARDQADALAQALGTTSSSMEAFSRQASTLSFTSYETASALQRITMAIEGQTAAGRQLREVIQGYGVDLHGVTTGQADQVLRQFVQSSRGFQSSPQNTQMIQQVLGPMDPGALQAINTPATMETLYDRTHRLHAQDVNRNVADTLAASTRRLEQSERDRAQLRDYKYNYNIGQLSGAQRDEVFAAMGQRPHDLVSTADKLAFFGALDQPDLAGIKETATSAWVKSARPGAFGRWQAHLSNGEYGANAINIAAREADEIDRTGSFWGAGGFSDLFRGHGNESLVERFGRIPFMRSMGRRVSNLFNYYEPVNDFAPPKPDPEPVAFQKEGNNAQTLAGYGFNEAGTQYAAHSRLRSLRAGDTPRGRGGDADSVRALIRFYQAQGMSLGEASTEAGIRYENAQRVLQRDMDQAGRPGEASINPLMDARFISSQPIGERGDASALLEFARTQGVGTSFWHGDGATLDSLTESGGITGGMTPGMRAGFQTLRAAQSGNDILESNNAREQAIDFQRKLQDAVPQGSAAVEQATAKWQAYNAAIAAHASPAATAVRMTNAQSEALASNDTALKRYLQTVKEKDADDRSRAAALMMAGSDPMARAQAEAGQTMTVEAEHLARSYTNYDQAQGMREARQRLGVRVTGQADQMLATQGTSLVEAQRIGYINPERDRRYVEADRQFAPLIGQAAEVSPQAAETMRAALAGFKALGDQLAGLQIHTDQMQFGLDTERDNGIALEESKLSPEELRRWSGVKPLYDRAKRSGDANVLGPEGNRLSPAETMDRLLHPDLITDPATRLSARALQEGQVIGEGAHNQTADRENRVALGREGARAGAFRGGGGAGRAAIAAAGVVDPNEENPEQAAARRASMAAAGLDTQRSERHAAIEIEIDSNARLARSILEGKAAYDAMSDTLAIEQSRRDTLSAAMTREELQRKRLSEGLKSDNTAINRNRNDSIDLAGSSRAWEGGRLSGEAFDRRRPYADELRSLDAQERTATDPAVLAAIKDRRAAIAGIGSSGDDAAYAHARQNFWQGNVSRDDDNELMRADLNAGPFASAEAQGNARGRVLAARQVRDSGGQVSFDQAYKSFSESEVLKRQVQDLEQVRQGFNSMESAAGSAFERAIKGGEQTRHIIHALAQDIEGQLLRTFVEQPIFKAVNSAMDSALGGLFGGKGTPSGGGGGGGGGASAEGVAGGLLGKAFSGMGDAASSAASGVWTWLKGAGTAAMAMFGTGGVIDRHASGGVLTQPTLIRAGGGTVMAGEIDHEAVMPLRRLPNGDLGIQSSGGGGGHRVSVYSPITIQNNGGGNGNGLSPSAQVAMRRQIEVMHTQAVRDILANERRDGGDLTQPLAVTSV